MHFKNSEESVYSVLKYVLGKHIGTFCSSYRNRNEGGSESIKGNTQEKNKIFTAFNFKRKHRYWKIVFNF